MNPTGPYMNPKWTPQQAHHCTSIWTPNGHPNGPPNEPPNGPSNEPPNKLPNYSLNQLQSSCPLLVSNYSMSICNASYSLETISDKTRQKTQPNRDGNSSENFIPRRIEESRNDKFTFLGDRGT